MGSLHRQRDDVRGVGGQLHGLEKVFDGGRHGIEDRCGIDSKGALRRDRRQRTTVPGVYVAGDSDRDPQMVIVAAAEGAKAAE